MTQHLIHLNDVIARWDTSVFRLANQYQVLRPYFSDTPLHTHLIGSSFGDSARTGTQLMYLISFFRTHPALMQWAQTICVNNASRAKHTDSGNAKWSRCLWATITDWLAFPLHIVGVDDHVFGTIREHINSLQEVKGIQRNTTVVNDISEGSQFRSMEFRPLVQYIVQYTVDPYLHLIVKQKEITELPATMLLESSDPRNAHLQGLSETLYEELTKVPSKDGYTIYPQWEETVLIQGDMELHKTFQYMQLCGETQRTKTRRHLSAEELTPPLIASCKNPESHEKYAQASLPELLPNELIVIDKDKFGNIKNYCIHPNGIYGLAEALGISVWDEVHISVSRNGQKVLEDTAYLVHTISDKTGEKCIRNGSSRGKNGEIFVELNRSIDDRYEGREFAEKLRIGDKVHISSWI